MSVGARLEELREELEEFQLLFEVYKEFFDVVNRLEATVAPDPQKYMETVKVAYRRAVSELVRLMYDE